MGVWLLGRCSGQQLFESWDSLVFTVFRFVYLLYRPTSVHALPGDAPFEVKQRKLCHRQWLRLRSQAGGSPASVLLRFGEESV